MKYDITHSCGCTETVDLLGTNSHGERDRKAAKLEAEPCAKCRAAAANEGSGMAELDGSDKQIAWASDIRRSMIAAVEALGGQMCAEEGHTEEEYATVRANIGRAVSNLKAATSSRWFIDHRDDKPVKAFKSAFMLGE